MTIIGLAGKDELLTEAGEKLLTEDSDNLILTAYEGLSLALSVELNGVWTDVSEDVRASTAVSLHYGIFGSGIMDRVADTGSMSFAMNNAESNSAGMVGYYTIGHANCRAGFVIGARVGLALSYNGQSYTKFVGRLVDALPAPGRYRERTVYCTVVDWMDEAANHRLQRIPVQVNRRADQLLETVLANMVAQPAAKSFGAGASVFPFALDQVKDGATALAEIQKIATSELGYVYLRGDGTLVFESRHARPSRNTSLATIDETMARLVVTTGRDEVINRVGVTISPREIGSTPEVLWTLQNKPNIQPDSSLALSAKYRDPEERSARISALSVVDPVEVTDYQGFTSADGTGFYIGPYLDISVDAGSDSAELSIYFADYPWSGYITLLQLRGIALRTFDSLEVSAEDTASQGLYGLKAESLDLVYGADAGMARDAANWLLSLYKSPRTDPESISFLGNRDQAHLLAALERDIGDRITVREAVSGVDHDCFINGVEMSIQAPGIVSLRWRLAPADASTYWLLQTAGYSELGQTTRLGY